jgi:hypothetical protein
VRRAIKVLWRAMNVAIACARALASLAWWPGVTKPDFGREAAKFP